MAATPPLCCRRSDGDGRLDPGQVHLHRGSGTAWPQVGAAGRPRATRSGPVSRSRRASRGTPGRAPAAGCIRGWPPGRSTRDRRFHAGDICPRDRRQAGQYLDHRVAADDRDRSRLGKRNRLRATRGGSLVPHAQRLHHPRLQGSLHVGERRPRRIAGPERALVGDVPGHRLGRGALRRPERRRCRDGPGYAGRLPPGRGRAGWLGAPCATGGYAPPAPAAMPRSRDGLFELPLDPLRSACPSAHPGGCAGFPRPLRRRQHPPPRVPRP